MARSTRRIIAALARPLATLALLVALPGTARAQGVAGWAMPQLTVAHWLLFVGVFVGFWLIFYFILYPYLLRFFSPEYSKVLFWSLFLFYAMTWLHLSSYLIFDIGFYFPAARWIAVTLTVLWLLWFVAVMVRGRRA